MELVQDKHKSSFDVKKNSNRTIFLSDKTYTEPIIFSNDSISLFPVIEPKHIKVDDLDNYLKGVELILIGTGEKNILLDEKLIKNMEKRKKGLEFMNTESACKTHNLLLSENRLFVSVLYP